jgi:hypothetical protein
MRVYQFRGMLLLNLVEPGDQIVSVWTRQGEKSTRTSLGGLLPESTTHK